MPRFFAHATLLVLLFLQAAAGHDAQAPSTGAESSTSTANDHNASAASNTQIPIASSSLSTSSKAATKSTITTAANSHIATHTFAGASTCASRTVNYITHTLPQQCLRTPRAPIAADTKEIVDGLFAGPWALTPDEHGSMLRYQVPVLDSSTPSGTAEVSGGSTASASDAPKSAPSVAGTAVVESGEAETDSPLDNSNFLSFEQWKKQNLAKSGQTPDTLGQKATGNQEPPRRPVVINNALDTLGEDAEIELDFGFGDPGADPKQWETKSLSTTQSTKEDSKSDISGVKRSKDAGKTCKERFNYASFDCAANVLKTNANSKSSSSVLIEHKDSYMLNECRTENKFIIVELCEDILVDTIVLANYEFFSSIFRTFRVSVSDRYPVKLDRWKVLGTFEARNSRDVQAFLVEAPMIWARYLRVEFLTHFGNEFYCPLSLLRVHGTTMMEEFRHEEEAFRGEDEDEPLDQTVEDSVIQSIPPVVLPPETIRIEHTEAAKAHVSAESATAASSTVIAESTSIVEEIESAQSRSSTSVQSDVETAATSKPSASLSASNVTSLLPSPSKSSEHAAVTSVPSTGSIATDGEPHGPLAEQGLHNVSSAVVEQSDHRNATIASSQQADDKQVRSVASSSAPASSALATPSQNASQIVSQVQATRSVNAAPPPPSPTTQESFFKSVHKRLQQLESNSTLSLQYIEEQSRILRDAFTKVEKRQLARIESFLQDLNVTVVDQLRGFRRQYDLLYQSTVLEVESQNEQHVSEMNAISSRLTLLADEIVFQKRMAVIQSTLLLLCLGLVLFVRSPATGSFEVPMYQHMSSSLREWRAGSPPPTSPPTSPPRRWDQRLRATMSEINLRRPMGRGTDGLPTDDERADTDLDGSSPSDNETDGPRSAELRKSPEVSIEPPSPEEADPTYREAQSGPATPRGSRDKQVAWLTDDQPENNDSPAHMNVREKTPNDENKENETPMSSPPRTTTDRDGPNSYNDDERPRSRGKSKKGKKRRLTINGASI